jgi:hypothetical protein
MHRLALHNDPIGQFRKSFLSRRRAFFTSRVDRREEHFVGSTEALREVFQQCSCARLLMRLKRAEDSPIGELLASSL